MYIISDSLLFYHMIKSSLSITFRYCKIALLNNVSVKLSLIMCFLTNKGIEKCILNLSVFSFCRLQYPE